MEELNTNFRIKKDLSISMLAANLYVFVFALPLIVIHAAAYSIIWDFNTGFADEELLMHILIFAPLFIMGVVVHEYIHGISWRLFGGLNKEDIKFGFQMETLTPYAHSKVPLKINVYRWGALMPFIILGEIPALLGLLFGNTPLFIYGLFFILAAGGDLAIVWTIRGVKEGKYVQDHPVRAGCYVLEKTD